MDRTYQELTQNDKRWVDLKINRKTGVAYVPSAAYYEVISHEKQNSVVPETVATINENQNRVSAFITETVTASAGDYDIIWRIRKNGNENFHCTRLLVNEC